MSKGARETKSMGDKLKVLATDKKVLPTKKVPSTDKRYIYKNVLHTEKGITYRYKVHLHKGTTYRLKGTI